MAKVALVTGSSKGIGSAIAKRLANESFFTFVTYSSDKIGGEKVVSEIVNSGGRAELLKLDLTNDSDINFVFDVINKQGRLDVLVNNAAIEIPKNFEQVSFEEYSKIISAKAHGAFKITQKMLPLLKIAKASIVNISSSLGSNPDFDYPGYCVATAMLDCLTKMWSVGLAKYGIRTNAILPTMTLTPMWDQLGGNDKEMWDSFNKANPMGRVSTPEDIAEAVSMIVNDKTGYINGNFIYVDGGKHNK